MKKDYKNPFCKVISYAPCCRMLDTSTQNVSSPESFIEDNSDENFFGGLN